MIDQILNDRYKILSQIGSGGMSIVYKALDMQTNSEVAIKVLRPELAEDEQILKRFNHEVKAASALSHPNIVKLIDIGNDGNVNYIVLDLVKGITLKDYINDHAPISPQKAATIVLGIAHGLKHAHSKNIIHRDIKPQNIIIDKNDAVKITDFGIARIVTDATRTTQYGQDMVGTVYYTSPEQIRGLSIDARSDIYSLGIVLYEMVTGRVPFDGETAVNIAMQHVTKEADTARKYNKEIPVDLDIIIKNAMAKKVENRYSTIDDMIKDLEKFIKGAPIKNLANRKEEKAQKHLDEKKKRKVLSKKAKNKKRAKLNALLLNLLLLILLSGIFILLIYGTVNLVQVIYQNNFVMSKVAVPDIVGDSADEARITLENKQLTFRQTSERYSSTIPEGFVIEQNPTAGTEVNEDAFVEVTVSLGAFTINVPYFVGELITDVEFSLKSNSYIVLGTYNYVESNLPENTVVAQSIPAGEFSLDGNTVTITLDVSKGPSKDFTTMINFVGLTYSSLEQLAPINNITIGNVTYVYHDTIKNGVVIHQSIEPDTVISTKEPVDFVVSLGPLITSTQRITISIPDYIAENITDDKVLVQITYMDSGEKRDAFKSWVYFDPELMSVDVDLTLSGTITFDIYLNNTFISKKTIKFS